jgi:hypothetical protein
MADYENRKQRITYAAVAAVISFCALMGWVTENLVFASIFAGWKAMAPLTALSVLLISVAIIAYNENKTKNPVAFLLALSVIIILMIVLADRAGLLFTGLEQLLIPKSLASSITNVNTGVISPLTIAVLFASSSVLILCSASKSKYKSAIVFICSIAVVFTGVLVALGYVLQNPILSGIVSLPTGFTFILYGIAIVMIADRESYPARLLIGNNIAAIILRRLFPLIMIFIIVQGLFVHLSELFENEKVFVAAIFIVIFVVFSILISIRTASAMSKKIMKLTDERDFARNEYYQSENKYETLVESLQEGIAILSKEGNTLIRV